MNVEEYDKLLSEAKNERERIGIFSKMKDDDDISFMQMVELNNKYPPEKS